MKLMIAGDIHGFCIFFAEKLLEAYEREQAIS